MKKSLAAAIAALMLAFPASALAHVEITPDTVAPGGAGLFTITAPVEGEQPMTGLLLRETTTLGVRYHEASRRVLERSIQNVITRFGEVRVKVALDGERTLHFQPEYEDCVKLAIEHGVPLMEIQAEASSEYQRRVRDAKKAGDGECEEE